MFLEEEEISKKLSCGVLVIDKNDCMLMLHVSTQEFWDIPKGTQNDGETPITTAIRELKEESSLVVQEGDLIELGHYFYNRYKDLWLYLLPVESLDASALKCESTFLSRDSREFPEVDNFRMIHLDYVEKYMCRSLSNLFSHELRKDLERALEKRRGEATS